MTTLMPTIVPPIGSHSVFVICQQQIICAGITLLINTQHDLAVSGSVGSYLDALPLIQSGVPKVIVLVMDAELIDDTGIVKLLKEGSPESKVLVLSDVDDLWPIRRILKTGASGYLRNASTSQNLFDAIRALAAGKFYLDPGMIEQLITFPRQQKSSEWRAGEPAVTVREEEVLRFVARGFRNREIAALLGVSQKTVEAHRTHGMKKLNLHRITDVIEYGMKQGWLDVGRHSKTGSKMADVMKNSNVIPLVPELAAGDDRDRQFAN